MIMLYFLKPLFVFLIAFQISFYSFAQVSTEVVKTDVSKSPWAGPMAQEPNDSEAIEKIDQRDILSRLPELESEGILSKKWITQKFNRFLKKKTTRFVIG